MLCRVAIAGAGPVARALGRTLAGCGIPIACVASRNPEHAAAAARFIGTAAVVSYSEIPRHASHVLLAVSDRAIAPVAGELARANGSLRVALHTCGSYGPEPLLSLAAAGVSCGGMHPLQTIRTGAEDLRGIAFALSGDAEACNWASEIANALNGRVLRIRPEALPLYHAAAVLASNAVTALLDSAEQLMLLAGVPADDALSALAPLARTALENAFALGPVDALTGPAVRGDAAIITSHARALERASPTIAAFYRAAGLHALTMARNRGLGTEQARAVEEALLGGR